MPPRRAFAHRPTEVLRQRHHGADVQGDDAVELGECAVEERLAAGVGAGVVDQQADLHVGGGSGDLPKRPRVDEIHRESADFGAVGAAFIGRVFQRVRLAGDEDEVEARGGKLPSEFGAHALRSARDHRPRTVLRQICHRSRVARA